MGCRPSIVLPLAAPFPPNSHSSALPSSAALSSTPSPSSCLLLISGTHCVSKCGPPLRACSASAGGGKRRRRRRRDAEERSTSSLAREHCVHLSARMLARVLGGLFCPRRLADLLLGSDTCRESLVGQHSAATARGRALWRTGAAGAIVTLRCSSRQATRSLPTLLANV